MNMQASNPASADLFSEAEHAALDARCTERIARGKPARYALCLVRNKEVLLTREERIRQLWLARLIDEYKYPLARLTVDLHHLRPRHVETCRHRRFTKPGPARPSPTSSVIEVKQPTLREGARASSAGARVTQPAPLSPCGATAPSPKSLAPQEPQLLHRDTTPCRTHQSDHRRQGQVNQPWTIQTLIDKEKEELTRPRRDPKARSLRDLIGGDGGRRPRQRRR